MVKGLSLPYASKIQRIFWGCQGAAGGGVRRNEMRERKEKKKCTDYGAVPIRKL